MISDKIRSQIYYSPEDALEAQKKLEYRLSPIVTPYLKARSYGKKQPVSDFLFEYYSFRPAKLMSWSPGYDGVVDSSWSPSDKLFRLDSDGWQLNRRDFPQKRIAFLEWTIALQQAILDRPPAFGCFGLHEWAMVYGISSEDVRHSQIRLRLHPDEIRDFVDSREIRCSHFDAFRFFTDEARPKNMLQPTYDTRLDSEQGGCIHANMDLYKWAYKLWPWVPSELVADAFMLAYETRKVDMRASPYNLEEEGFEPIKIETEAGRKLYQQEQKLIADKALLLRSSLLRTLEGLRDWLGHD